MASSRSRSHPHPLGRHSDDRSRLRASSRQLGLDRLGDLVPELEQLLRPLVVRDRCDPVVHEDEVRPDRILVQAAEAVSRSDRLERGLGHVVREALEVDRQLPGALASTDVGDPELGGFDCIVGHVR